jgi:hypothetical protein
MYHRYVASEEICIVSIAATPRFYGRTSWPGEIPATSCGVLPPRVAGTSPGHGG